jgi:hypothetical protein
MTQILLIYTDFKISIYQFNQRHQRAIKNIL